MSRDRGAEKGQAIVLIALMMAVLVGFTALAIDSARAFDGRRILQASVDAAALAGAEYYQAHPLAWSAAEGVAADEFERDNRIYGSYFCSPASVVPTAGASFNSPMTCMMPAGSNASLSITPADAGPGGQSFLLSAARTVNVALMQVLSQSSSINLVATSAAVANDQALTPALAGLSQNGCYPSGGTNPLSITSSSNPITIVGDAISNGSFNVDILSFPKIAGNVLTRCAAPVNGSTNIVPYYCWPSGAAPSSTAPACSGNDVQGNLVSTSWHLADPGYPVPPNQASPVPAPGTNAVNLPAGSYASSPFTVSNSCYFLSGGIYQWTYGITITGGMTSNELKPPAEGGTVPFWRLPSGTSTCEGSFAGVSATSPSHGIPNGNWPVVVTSVRNAVYNGTFYKRESAPSTCQLVSVVSSGNSGALAINVSNVPGAQSYNVYTAAPPLDCSNQSQLGYVGNIPIPSAQNPTNTNLSTTVCPDPTGTRGCSMGAAGYLNPVPVFFDNTSIVPPSSSAPPDTSGAYPPSIETGAFFGVSGLPNSNPARAVAGTITSASVPGDRANENACQTIGASPSVCPAAITPDAVEWYASNNTCINVTGGDAFLFSGYQYDWVLNYSTSKGACTNNWNGVSNSAAIGLSYAPSSAFNITGNTSTNKDSFSLEAPTGGIIASTIAIGHCTGLVIDYKAAYAPSPAGARLTA